MKCLIRLLLKNYFGGFSSPLLTQDSEDMTGSEGERTMGRGLEKWPPVGLKPVSWCTGLVCGRGLGCHHCDTAPPLYTTTETCWISSVE